MYRVRYRQVTDVDGNNLIDSADNQVTDYEYLTVEFGTTAVVIKGLGPNNTYEFGVACIDNSGFSGGFAVITAQQMPTDSTVPPQPTPPENTFGSIASNAARVQITHKLGAAKTVAGAVISSPTNFTLPRDIDHLNVYRGTTSSFTISASNFVGEIQARAGHIDGNITAVQSFDISTAGGAYYRVTAVDVAGNESDPSTAVLVTEELIGTQYIEDASITTIKVGEAQITDAKIDTMTASKITAGTISGKEIIVDTDSATDPANPVVGKIRSSNYVTGNTGWIINSDGSAEFQSATIRGTLNASDITTGTLDASGITVSNVSASSITSGSLSADRISGGTIDANNVTIDNLTVSSANVTGSFNASVINAGTLSSDRIPDLNASKITAGTMSADRISGGTITGTTMSADLISGGSISADLISGGSISADLISGGSISADLISGGSIDASYFTGSAGFTNLTASSIGITGAITATSSITAGSFVNSGSYIRGTEFRGSGTAVDIHRNSTSNGIKISGSGSGAYLYGYSFSGTQQTIYSPFSGVSDERLKENVADLTVGLDEINALRPVTFDWKASDIDDIPNERYGFIAQEVEEVIPEAVANRKNGFKGVKYELLVPVLIEAVKELSGTVSKLEEKLEKLESSDSDRSTSF